MKNVLISIYLLLASGCATVAYAQVPINGSTVQGQQVQTGNLVVGANSLGGTPWSPSNALGGTFSQGSWISFNNNGGSNGETDFINYHPGSLAGGFAWFTPSTSSLGAQVMFLSPGGTLTVNQVNANVTGSLTGNASTATLATNATTAATTSGNAATATALAATPSGCGTGYQHVYAIAANGNGSCGTPVYGITTSVTSTANSANATASSTVPLFWKFGGTAAPVTMPDTAYAASCTIVSPFGFPTVTGITKGTTSITVTIMNGTSSAAVTSGGSEIDCTVTGS
jgi:hypothetical protein